MSDIKNKEVIELTSYNGPWYISFPKILDDYINEKRITIDLKEINAKGVLIIRILQSEDMDSDDYIELAINILNEASASEMFYDKFSGNLRIWWD